MFIITTITSIMIITIIIIIISVLTIINIYYWLVMGSASVFYVVQSWWDLIQSP